MVDKRVSILAVAACFCAGPMPVIYTDAFLVQHPSSAQHQQQRRRHHAHWVVSSNYIRATASDPREVVIPDDFRVKKIRVRLTDAGSLEIKIPPVGIRNETQDGWLLAPVMSYRTVLLAWELRSISRVIANPGLFLVSTTWTVCNVALLKNTVWQYCRPTKLTIGTYTTILEKGKNTLTEFPTYSMQNVTIGNHLSINKKELPAIFLSTDQKKYSFGHGLPEREMQWLSQVIDAWLDANKSQIKGGMLSLIDSIY